MLQWSIFWTVEFEHEYTNLIILKISGPPETVTVDDNIGQVSTIIPDEIQNIVRKIGKMINVLKHKPKLSTGSSF